MMKNYLTVVFMLALFVLKPASSKELDIETSHSGYGYFQFGQIMKGVYRSPESNMNPEPVDHVWDQETAMGYGFFALVNDRTKVSLNSEIKLAHSFPQSRQNDFETFQHSYQLLIYQADAVHYFGDPETPFLEVALGISPYKYNSEVRNLGEYLFRSEIYAPAIINHFDWPAAHLLGARVSGHFFNNRLNMDLWLTSEKQTVPEKDLSLSWIGSFDITSFLQIGGGVSFSRLFSMEKGIMDSIPLSEPELYGENMYITPGTDTIITLQQDTIIGKAEYIPFHGTKLMGRATFDLRKLMGEPEIFGENDLKIYAEAAVLGTKNYSDFYIPIHKNNPTDSLTPYADLFDRVPMMFGINLPAFRILDVLAFEFEYFKFNEMYPNSLRPREKQREPSPLPEYEYQDMKIDTVNNYPAELSPFKWSLYFSKNVFDCVNVIGMIGRDHIFLNSNVVTKTARQEMLVGEKHWRWALKVLFKI
ncbi:MAG: hypothetical protein HQK83_10985 [Fibrobacteria bacterium]|nr:hypothetical protein [Fibrobacteria bacterium]